MGLECDDNGREGTTPQISSRGRGGRQISATSSFYTALDLIDLVVFVIRTALYIAKDIEKNINTRTSSTVMHGWLIIGDADHPRSR